MKARVFLRSVFHAARLTCTPAGKLGRRVAPAAEDVIVSLTTIPSRLGSLHLTIKSLLDQDVAFDRIILWVHRDSRNALPAALAALVGERFEIRYSETTEPHRKLVETLKVFPGRIIVTCDDDMMYPRDWLRRLLESWRQTPGDIVAHMCRKIRIEDGEILPYRRWRGEARGHSSPLTLALGWGGVLFPPGSLDPRVFDREAYLRLSPRADDLWFKAMAMLGGTAMRKSREPNPEPVPILGSQTFSLGRQNIGEDQNRVQLLALIAEFDLDFGAAAAREAAPETAR